MTIHANNCDQSLNKRIVTYKIEALAAGVDLADIPVFRCPSALQIIDIGIIPQVTGVGIDAGRTSVFAIEVGAVAIASKTYTTDYPAKGTYDSLGAISNAKRAEGDAVTLSVTNGATANPTGEILQIEYVVLDEAMFDAVHNV